MNDFKRQLDDVLKGHHCQNCGKIDPKVLDYGHGESANFTECCHDFLCKGNNAYIFGNDEITVEACCWAVAELKFKFQGIDVLKQKGMTRFDPGQSLN